MADRIILYLSNNLPAAVRELKLAPRADPPEAFLHLLDDLSTERGPDIAPQKMNHNDVGTMFRRLLLCFLVSPLSGASDQAGSSCVIFKAGWTRRSCPPQPCSPDRLTVFFVIFLSWWFVFFGAWTSGAPVFVALFVSVDTFVCS